MAKYGNGVYGLSLYGETPRLAYSTDPMSITVIDFSKVLVTWSQPTGNYTKFRLVRNQWGFPETAEDGEIIFEQNSGDGNSLEGRLSTLSFTDGQDNPYSIPLTTGSPIYYSTFMFTSDKVWVTSGSIYDVVPFNTGAINKTLDLLPRVITSKENSPFGTIDENTIIYQFLDAIAFTYEQMTTNLSLLRPQHNRDKSVLSTIPAESMTYGLTVEPNLPVANQHRLVREAIYLYQNRGTIVGLEDYAESLTGYAPAAVVSPNLLLSIQDSTFYKSVGNWTATGGTISYSNEIEPDITVTNCIDGVYTCKIVASGAGNMTLGLDNPLLKGVPVLPSTDYTLSVKIKSPTSDGSITPTILYYDKSNTLVSTNNGTSTAANNTWKVASVTKTSDSTASYAGVKLTWSAAGTYYVDMVCVQQGTVVLYDEARAVTLTLSPIKTNYIKNPSFENDASTWILNNTTFSQDTSVPFDGFSGSYSGKFLSSGNWSITSGYEMVVDPGSYITFSLYARSSNMGTLNMYIDTYDNTDTLVTTRQTTVTLTDNWTRFSLNKLITADSTEAYAKVRIQGGAGTVYLDMIQFEDSYRCTDYFDGSMPEKYGAVWEGTPHASVTYLYPNKLVKIPRLANTISDWLPINTWWRIKTLAALEYTNLTV